MSRGIIYSMRTIVPGLIKIGRTATNSFEDRMYNLEKNGYSNITGLKREFAIEVDEYEEKEKLLHKIFDRSRISNTELFSLDINLVVELLSSFEGKQIYPKDISKEEMFDISSSGFIDDVFLPEGEYFLNRNVKGIGEVKGKAIVKNKQFIIQKGSICSQKCDNKAPKIRKNANIKNNILQEDIVCPTPSAAGWVVIGKSNDGWREWKDKNGNSLDFYRSNKK